MKKDCPSLIIITLLLLLASGAGCSLASGKGKVPPQPGEPALAPTQPETLSRITPPFNPTITPTGAALPSPSATTPVFEVGKELTISYLRSLEIVGSAIIIHEKLAAGYNYQRYLVSYLSEGYRIYGLLTVPFGDPPPGGFKAIVFIHGYIPPDEYRTLERYTAYVDYLARSGFVVFKIDLRGHGESEGFASGTYFSPGYTIDAISAVKSLKTLDDIDPHGIGIWGHSMAGNLVLRAMLIEPEIKAGVIWAGAVYSYDDFEVYGINDTSYRPPVTPESQDEAPPLSSSQVIMAAYGRPDSRQAYWQAVSLTENIGFLDSPLQIHHAEDDPVVDIGYSYGLAGALQAAGKAYEFYVYDGGGHNIASPWFDLAMSRTVKFFQDNL
jgi:dipeptidyl aminopeptidase/acylaminoacyl peptidase